MKPAESATRAMNLINRTGSQYELDENGITELLTDLRHLCDTQGYKFSELSNQASIYYVAERLL